MNVDLLGWIVLLVAVLFTLYILVELWRGETTSFRQHGFFETVGGDKVPRRTEPLRYWLLMFVRGCAMAALWMLWYACWFVAR